MKKIVKSLTITLVLIIIQSICFAQTDVSVNTLSVIFAQERDTIINPEQRVMTEVLFKIEHPENADKVYIQLGSAKDNGEIINDELSIVLQNGVYKLSKTGESYNMEGDLAYFIYRLLPTEKSSVQWATVYIQDKNGILSEKKYFKCY